MKFGITLLSFLFAAAATSKAQTNPELPYAINSSGGYGIINGLMFDFNIGEMVLVQTFTGSPGFLLTQGFLQPFFLLAPPVNDVIVDNNIITPNNDGKNDFFIIKGLDRYPDHKVSIFDRAGRRIFYTTNYKNEFDGTYNGKTLSEDAYYYVIDLGKGFGLIRGSISIILDNK